MSEPISWQSAPARTTSRKAADVFPFLEAYIAKKQSQIAEIEQSVDRYEKKRMMEERAYQTMSTLRRMLSGKKPDHHIAVEYIHYVRKPMEKVRALRQDIELASNILQHASPNDDITLSSQMEQDWLQK